MYQTIIACCLPSLAMVRNTAHVDGETHACLRCDRHVKSHEILGSAAHCDAGPRLTSDLMRKTGLLVASALRAVGNARKR